MIRTTYTLVILSEDKVPDDMSFEDIIYQANEGSYVMDAGWASTEMLTREQMADALIAAGSEPSFFDL